MPSASGRLPFRTVAVLTVMLPLLGFITCVAWSLKFDFKSSTATHCGVSFILKFEICNTFFMLPCISPATYNTHTNICRCTITFHQYQLQLGTIFLKDIFGEL